MSKAIPMRVSFATAPGVVLKQIFGEAKNSKNILDALEHYEGQAHEQELFHYLNTDENGEWILVQGTNGEAVPLSMVNLRKQLATMVMTGQVKRLGERSARYALPSYQPTAEEAADEGEDEGEDGAE